MDKIRRLRALEKKWRELAEKSDSIDLPQKGQIFRWCAEDISSLIAELGQEVGAVAPAWFYVRTPGADYDYTFTKTREEAIDLQDCDEPDEPIPLYTSPAHASEARDAARWRWMWENDALLHAKFGKGGMHVGFVVLTREEPDASPEVIGEGATEEEAIDAAMRQEGE